MAKWVVLVSRFDGSKGTSQTVSDYNKAKTLFDSYEKLPETKRESAGGKVLIKNETGVTMNSALIS